MMRIQREREPELGDISCLFFCGLSYETRRGIRKNLKKANNKCSRPSYDSCFVCLIKSEAPKIHNVSFACNIFYDVRKAKVTRLRTYNGSIIMAVSNSRHTITEMKVTTSMIRALDLVVPFGIYFHPDRGINSLSCK